MSQKISAATLIAIVVIGILTASTGHTIIAPDTKIHLNVLSESKGVSGQVLPRFANDPGIGANCTIQWRTFNFGLTTARFIGLRSIFLGNSGYTMYFANTDRQVNNIHLHIQHAYIDMKSILPRWLLWDSGDRQETLVKARFSKNKARKWYPYAIGGAILGDHFLKGNTLMTVAGIGYETTIPINQSINLTIDVAAITTPITRGKDGETAIRGTGALIITPDILPVALKLQLNMFKNLSDEANTWSELSIFKIF